MKSKKIFMLLSLMAVIGLSACESGAEAEPQSYVVSETPETEITVTDKFSDAEEDISQSEVHQVVSLIPMIENLLS